MAIWIDPYTRQRVLFSPLAGDFTYDMIGNPAVAQEDVPVIGGWEDWTGSGGIPSQVQQHFASIENQLQGQDAQIIDNAKLPNLSVIGTRVGTHRRRTRRIYVNPSNS